MVVAIVKIGMFIQAFMFDSRSNNPHLRMKFSTPQTLREIIADPFLILRVTMVLFSLLYRGYNFLEYIRNIFGLLEIVPAFWFIFPGLLTVFMGQFSRLLL